MSIKRITISVPSEVARRIKKAAGARPVSSWVTGVIEDHLDEAELERLWEAFYADVAPSEAEKRAAEASVRRLLSPAPRERGRRRGAA